MTSIRFLLPVALLAEATSCSSAGGRTSRAGFSDATAANVPAAPNLHALDAAMLDVDSDGDLDVAVAVENDVSRLYLNDGKGKLSWRQGAFGTARHDNEHVETADFNKDGHADLIFVAEYDQDHQLFLGDGRGGFVDASDRLPAQSQANGLAVGDVNGDGLPDIVVGNSAESRAERRAPAPQDFLWLNTATNPGHFVDATATHMPKDAEYAQGIALADLDGDGDLDMFVANETPPNRLFLNDGKSHFSDASDRLDLKVPLETREVHVFDANRDGRPDILFLNLTSNNQDWDKDPQSRLLINDGEGRWRDETDTRLPRHRFSSWGGSVVDFDHDGAPDLLVGAIEVPSFKPLQLRAWHNDGSGHFSDQTVSVVPQATVGRSWSMAQGDIDGDGKPDIFIGGWGTQARLLLSGSGSAR